MREDRLASLVALIEKWRDPEFWKDEGCRMDSMDWADQLAQVLASLREKNEEEKHDELEARVAQPNDSTQPDTAAENQTTPATAPLPAKKCGQTINLPTRILWCQRTAGHLGNHQSDDVIWSGPPKIEDTRVKATELIWPQDLDDLIVMGVEWPCDEGAQMDAADVLVRKLATALKRMVPELHAVHVARNEEYSLRLKLVAEIDYYKQELSDTRDLLADLKSEALASRPGEDKK